MNVSLIVAHPNPDSFNHAISVTCGQTLQARGHRVFYHDLYAERFNPLLPYDEIEDKESVPDDLNKQHQKSDRDDDFDGPFGRIQYGSQDKIGPVIRRGQSDGVKKHDAGQECARSVAERQLPCWIP